MKTARAWTPGENLFVVLLVMAPSSQKLEPPINPERFRLGNGIPGKLVGIKTRT